MPDLMAELQGYMDAREFYGYPMFETIELCEGLVMQR